MRKLLGFQPSVTILALSFFLSTLKYQILVENSLQFSIKRPVFSIFYYLAYNADDDSESMFSKCQTFSTCCALIFPPEGIFVPCLLYSEALNVVFHLLLHKFCVVQFPGRSDRTLSSTEHHLCDVFVLPRRKAAEMSSATRCTFRRNTTSIMKI